MFITVLFPWLVSSPNRVGNMGELVFCRYAKPLCWTNMFISVAEKRPHVGSGDQCWSDYQGRRWGQTSLDDQQSLWWNVSISVIFFFTFIRIVCNLLFGYLFLLIFMFPSTCNDKSVSDLSLLVSESVQMTFNYVDKCPNNRFMQLYGFSTLAVRTHFNSLYYFCFNLAQCISEGHPASRHKSFWNPLHCLWQLVSHAW